MLTIIPISHRFFNSLFDQTLSGTVPHRRLVFPLPDIMQFISWMFHFSFPYDILQIYPTSYYNLFKDVSKQEYI